MVWIWQAHSSPEAELWKQEGVEACRGRDGAGGQSAAMDRGRVLDARVLAPGVGAKDQEEAHLPASADSSSLPQNSRLLPAFHLRYRKQWSLHSPCPLYMTR